MHNAEPLVEFWVIALTRNKGGVSASQLSGEKVYHQSATGTRHRSHRIFSFKKG